MRVKRYLVESMPDALEKIRHDLGKDAVILNTKQVKIGGFFGLFGKHRIEVIAAADHRHDANHRHTTADNPATGNRLQAQEQQQDRKLATAEPNRSGSAAQELATPSRAGRTEAKTGQLAPLLARQAYQQQPEATQRQAQNASQPESVEPKIRTGTALATRTEEAEATVQSRTEDLSLVQNQTELANEIRYIRQMFDKLLLHDKMQDTLPPPLVAVRDRLQAQSVDPALIRDIMNRLIAHLPEPNAANEQEINRHAADILVSLLEKGATRPPGIASTARFAFFFGPTGVGKTTTIAKLAAEYMLNQRRRVGFITSDTFRIAAVEQLKTYANILNAPLEVVFSAKEMGQAVERLHDCDLIFVDTAGRNYRNNEYVDGMKEYLLTSEQSEYFLVLSLTAKDSDMQAIINNFRDIPAAKTVFTKADETDSYGSILNVICRHELSLSYLTNGQNVPADIVVATPQRLATMILGEDVDA